MIAAAGDDAIGVREQCFSKTDHALSLPPALPSASFRALSIRVPSHFGDSEPFLQRGLPETVIECDHFQRGWTPFGREVGCGEL